jgi:hypothetical protein
VTVLYHLPERPAWTCQVCQEPYPCATRRVQLLGEFGGASVQLTVFMNIDFRYAAAELPGVPADDLHRRFFWYRYPTGSAEGGR